MSIPHSLLCKGLALCYRQSQNTCAIALAMKPHVLSVALHSAKCSNEYFIRRWCRSPCKASVPLMQVLLDSFTFASRQARYLSEHIVCQEEGILKRCRLSNNIQQPVVGDNNQGVHIPSERLNAVRGLRQHQPSGCMHWSNPCASQPHVHAALWLEGANMATPIQAQVR